MDEGYLSKHFSRIAAKRLSGVEINPKKSHQHELNGTSDLKKILGPDWRKQQTAKFLYLDDDEERITRAEAMWSWYDARDRHPTRSEYRLYFGANEVMSRAKEDDSLILCLDAENNLTFIVVAGQSTTENQVRWLFGLPLIAHNYVLNFEPQLPQDQLAFVADTILTRLDLVREPLLANDRFLDELLREFGTTFPRTDVFSAFARKSLGRSPGEDPDDLLIGWMNHEQILFETLERHIVRERLKVGFGEDVDEFLAFSLSVQNRRKSRAGYAMEHHLEAIFKARDIRYRRGGKTEGKASPDFLFPGDRHYHDPAFSAALLTMLGVKTTCKDRWRQVLAEADRISRKHLATLEPSISRMQTDEMKSKELTLVVPKQLQSTYLPQQQADLMNLSDFISLVASRQS